MAPSVNSDVKAPENSNTAEVGNTEWLSTLTKAMVVGASENEKPRADIESGESEANEETSDASLSVEQIRDKYDIEDFTGDGLMEFKVDDDKTVGQKAAEDFIQGIRDDIKSGKLSEDSDEAKLIDLMDAQSAIDNGYDLYGYAETIQWGDVTYRESQTDPTHLTGDDVKEMVDEDKLAEEISSLMQEEGISKRYDDALEGAIEAVPVDKLDSLKSQVKEALFEPDSRDPNLNFEAHVIAMKEKAEASGDEELSDKIQLEVDHYFEALQALDPES